MVNSKQYGAVGNFLKKHLDKDSELTITSSYFTIYAYKELQDKLENISRVRFLFNEPTFIEKLDKGSSEVRTFSLKNLSREKAVSEFPWEISLKNNLNQNKIAKACAKFISEKAEVKSIKNEEVLLDNTFLIKDKVQISGKGLDFTQDGLGYSERIKHQFINQINDINALQQYEEFFDYTWNNEEDVKDVKEELLSYIEKLYKENSPELIYYVTLYHLFNEDVSSLDDVARIKEETGIHNTKIWDMLYNFQEDAVIGAIKKLELYNGCIIADSVGLGKTFEALAVIKYYQLRNDRVLVLVPKKLRSNWVGFKMNTKTNPLIEDRFNYDVLNHTDLSRERGKSGDIDLSQINWGNYDLVVIDESHNFRNNNPKKGKVTRYEKLMNDVMKAGVKTKVLMLSATPVNNTLTDLRNQLLFITEGQDDAFEEKLNIPSIRGTLQSAQREFQRWSEKGGQDIQTLLPNLNYDFFSILNALTIARSRKHIQKYYDTKDIGEFPTRLKPKYIKTDIDTDGKFPTMKDINDEIAKLNLAIYSPLHYVLPTRIKKYEEKYDQIVKGGKSKFSQADREQSLINLMRVNILKRLESSIESYRLTIERIYNQTITMIKTIETNTKSLEYGDEEFDDEEIDDLEIGNKVRVNVEDLDKIKILQNLKEDEVKLKDLLKYAREVTPDKDKKLKTIKEEIKNKILNPINNDNNKVIVFTAFADTASYLYEHLSIWLIKEFNLHTGVVTGSNITKANSNDIQNHFESLLTHFSPKSNKMEVATEISLLVATDCISEGQNLQDCDYLINYDIHWNPVRIIQRFGRIDRIGSTNTQIQLVNFWPNMELDEYINLEQRVKTRMAMVDFTGTGEDDLLNPKSKDLKYRKDQLEQLQSDVMDLEDLSGGISITDLTLDDYIMNLERFMKENPGLLEKYSTGIHAVTEVGESFKDNLLPGVIFCLKQKSNGKETKTQNSLHPYHLIYVQENGEILVDNTNPKKALDYFKGLTAKQNEVQQKLVYRFNQETDDGQDMSNYTYLLEKAINNIKGFVEAKGVQSLFTLGESNILENHVSGIDDFELITFLVIL